MDKFCHEPDYYTFNQLNSLEKYAFNKICFLNKQKLSWLTEYFKYRIYLAVKAYRHVNSHKIYTLFDEYYNPFCCSPIIRNYIKNYPTIYQFYLNYFGKPYDKNLIQPIDVDQHLNIKGFDDFFSLSNIDDKNRMAEFIANVMYKFRKEYYIYTCTDDRISQCLYDIFYSNIDKKFEDIERETDVEIYPHPKIIQIELNS